MKTALTLMTLALMCVASTAQAALVIYSEDFEEAAELGEKSLLRIDRRADDPVDVCVNGKVIARGRLVVVGDNYGVEITEIVEGTSRPR